MYLVIDKQTNNIIHTNNHPYNNLTNIEAYALFDESKHACIFAKMYNPQYHKIENFKVVGRTPKEITEFRIENGIDSPLTNSQKIDDDGNIIEKTNKEKYLDGILIESYYKELLIDNLTNVINNKFNTVIESGTTYKDKNFQANEISCNRINNAITFSETSGIVTPYWIASDNSVYQIIDLEDLKNLGLTIGNCFQSNFFKRTQLRDSLITKTIEQLENYSVEMEWGIL